MIASSTESSNPSTESRKTEEPNIVIGMPVVPEYQSNHHPNCLSVRNSGEEGIQRNQHQHQYQHTTNHSSSKTTVLNKGNFYSAAKKATREYKKLNYGNEEHEMEEGSD